MSASPRRPSGDKTGKNHMDRAKQDVKRSQVVEGRRMRVGVAVDSANRPEMKLVEQILQSIRGARTEPTKERPHGPWTSATPTTNSERSWSSSAPQRISRPRGRKRSGSGSARWDKAARLVPGRTDRWLNRF